MNKIYKDCINAYGVHLLETIPNTQSIVSTLLGEESVNAIIAIGNKTEGLFQETQKIGATNEELFHNGIAKIIENPSLEREINNLEIWKLIIMIRTRRQQIENILISIERKDIPKHKPGEAISKENIEECIKKSEVFIAIVKNLLKNDKNNSK